MTQGGVSQGGMTQARGLQLLLLAVVLFGGVWPVSLHALAHATPVWFATSRAALAAIASTLLLVFGHAGTFAVRCQMDGVERFRAHFRVSQGN